MPLSVPGCNPQMQLLPRAAAVKIGSGSARTISAKGIAVFQLLSMILFGKPVPTFPDHARGGRHHADLATGRMAETARFFAWRGGRRARPMGGAGGADRRR